MTAAKREPALTAARRRSFFPGCRTWTEVEQAIARGWYVDRIIAHHDVTEEQVWAVVDRMDSINAPSVRERVAAERASDSAKIEAQENKRAASGAGNTSGGSNTPSDATGNEVLT